MASHRLRSLTGIFAAAAATVWLSGCADKPAQSPSAQSPSGQPSPAQPDSAQPDSAQPDSTSTPPPTQAPRTENWTKLEAGDCLAEAPPTDPAVVMVTVVDCSQPHLAETFLRAPIPVDAALEGTANAQCEAGFAQYTGRASAGSPFTVSYMIDSDQDRTANNPLPSTVICLLQGAGGEALTGSARG